MLNIARNRPVVDKFVSIAGAVSEPATVCVPVGTSYRDVLAHFEITVPDYVIRSGGLMMGALETDLNAVVTKTTGALIVLPADHYCVRMYQRYSSDHQTDRLARASCDQCSFCTDLCPRYLLGYPVRPETAMRNRMFTRENWPLVHSGNAFCCECNLCTMYACPEGLNPKGATVIEKQIAAAQPKWEGLPVKLHPMMEYRKVPTRKLMQRLDVLQFQDVGPLLNIEFSPGTVRIPLKQHIGAPAKPLVAVGDSVVKYDCIAEAAGEISVPVHASVSGTVTAVNEQDIMIEKTV